MKKIGLDKGKIKNLIWGRFPEIALEMGISTTSLSRKINGSQPLSIDELNRLATIIEVRVDELLLSESKGEEWMIAPHLIDDFQEIEGAIIVVIGSERFRIDELPTEWAAFDTLDKLEWLQGYVCLYPEKLR